MNIVTPSGVCPQQSRPQYICRELADKRSFIYGTPVAGRNRLISPLFAKGGVIRPQLRGLCKSRKSTVCSAQAIRENPFTRGRELDGVEKAFGEVPKAAQIAGAVVGVIAAGAAGALAGGRVAPADLQNIGKVAGGAVAASVAAFLIKNLEAKRATAASAELWNLLASLGDPDQLDREAVAAVGEKYGVDLNKRLLPDLSRVYDVYLEKLIPPGDKPLNGDEVERLLRFKGALGLSDEEAAPVHITVGQRIMRGRIEAPDRYSEAQERRTLQKLIYISNLAFGDQKAAFLLPWARVFNMTDAQLFVAKRDNARALFKQHLDQLGGSLPGDREGLQALRRVQQQYKLVDEEAEAEVKLAARNQVDKFLTAAVECIKKKARVRDYSDAVRETNALLGYNRRLVSLSKEEGMVPGLGPVSVYGGKFESGGPAKDIRELFKVFVEERIRLDDGFSDQLADDVQDLSQIVALGSKEADELKNEVVTKIYKRMLSQKVVSGELDRAESKAEVLNDLCDNLQFDSEAAAELHGMLYRQKLETFLQKKRLSDEDAVELDKTRIRLCIPNSQVAQIHQDVCGRIYKMAVDEAMDVGFQRFQPQDRDRVRSVRQDVRLEPSQALQILDATARKRMLTFVTKARSQRNKLDGAKELKNMVYFSNIVVAPLVYDIKNAEKTQKQDVAGQRIAELAKKAQEERSKSGTPSVEESIDPTNVTIDVTAETIDESYTEEEKKKAMEELLETDLEKAERKHALEELENAVVREDARLAAERKEAEEVLSEAAAEFKAKQEGLQAAERKEAEEVLADAVREDEKDGGKAADDASSAPQKKPEDEATAGKKEEGRIKSQKDITLKEDLALKDRLDIYQNYLLYCVSGEVVEMPMGGSITVARDASEFERLQELGDVLGLTPMDMASVRLDLAEKGFRQQVQEALSDGNLTPEKVERLNEIRDQLGLPKEAADKVIKGVQSQNLRKVIVAQDAMGTLNLQKILDLKEQGVDVEGLLSLEKRTDLYSKEVAAQLSAGTGEFDKDRMLKTLPEELSLPEGKVRQVLERLAKDKKRLTLVQAISYLRQKKMDDATQSLNNLVACTRALPSDKPMEWSEADEIQDLYCIYIGREHSPEKQAEARAILGIGAEEAARLEELVKSGAFRVEEEEEEGAIF